jgi:hypothetical protein
MVIGKMGRETNQVFKISLKANTTYGDGESDDAAQRRDRQVNDDVLISGTWWSVSSV